MLRQLQTVKMELRKRMHDPIAKTGAWLTQMLQGHLNHTSPFDVDPRNNSGSLAKFAAIRRAS
jgi:hypothetical protein